ncbi:RNA-directed DNA polymerase, eukaryota, reverse transcriptase zinc-binding domain protein, partial [Tanacetum coccineum]
LIDWFHTKLSSSKANLLSIGGRLTLIKAVLGSFGIYYLSIFKVPEIVLKILESIRALFFWGGSQDSKKIAWIKWTNVLSSFDKGGLGVGSLKSFSLTILQKWRWRFPSYPNSLWVQVIKALHGNEGGFDHHRFGCGNLVCFWKDIWIGDSPLHIRFNRFFLLEQDKDCLIRDRFSNGHWCWSWSRFELGIRNSAYLRDMLSEISHVFICSDSDSFVWSLANDGVFSVSVTCRHIDDHLFPTLNPPTTWDKIHPRKVYIFMWRLRLDRLPHHLNLSSRGIEISEISCPSCNGNLESNHHIFFECDIATDLEACPYVLQYPYAFVRF